jgi:hypothetical protein
MPVMSLSGLPHDGKPNAGAGHGILHVLCAIEAVEDSFAIFDLNG